MGVLVAHTLTLRMIGQVRFVSQRATLVGLGRGLWANESAGRLGLSEKVLNLASAPGLLFSPRWSSTHTRTKDEHTEERNNQRREEQMKIWRQLNDKDEAERTRIASLIAAVSKHTKDAHQLPPTEQVASTQQPSELSLPDTPEAIGQLLERFLYHESPSSELLLALIHEVAPLLRQESNLIELENVGANEHLTVVGDLHGDLEDLQAVFEASGLPSETNRFIFNGDFVDRGHNGVEVITILLACKRLFPSSITLLRGNHEDVNLGKAYGFFDEVLHKYRNKSLYHNLADLFSLLPLAARVPGVCFVAHGGVSRRSDTTVDDINAIPRYKYKKAIDRQSQEHAETETSARKQQQRELLEDLLWSDPDAYEDGFRENSKRGAGVLYGPDTVRQWLEKMEVPILIRSHECMEDGYEEIDCGEGKALYTVFSSSNYSGGHNLGAVLRFSPGDSKPRALQFDAPEPRSLEEIEQYNQHTIRELIGQHAEELKNEFKQMAESSSAGHKDRITMDEWDSALTRVFSLDIDWASAVEVDFACQDCPAGTINYRVFLSTLLSSHCQKEVQIDHDQDELQLMSKHRELSAIFRLFDIGEDGEISKHEFITACNLLNHVLPKEKQCKSEELFRLADTNGNGKVDYEEFCSLFGASTRK